MKLGIKVWPLWGGLSDDERARKIMEKVTPGEVREYSIMGGTMGIVEIGKAYVSRIDGNRMDVRIEMNKGYEEDKLSAEDKETVAKFRRM